MAEVRKLLDRGNEAKAFGVLAFHCNWALHPSLSHDAARNFVSELNDSYRALGTGATAEEGAKALWDKLSFDHFRKQLSRFLARHQLPSDICADPEWQSFLHLYSHVIQDCPLVCSGDAALADLRFDRLVLTAVNTGTNMLGLGEIAIEWSLFLNGERVGDWVFRPGRGLIGRTFLKARE